MSADQKKIVDRWDRHGEIHTTSVPLKHAPNPEHEKTRAHVSDLLGNKGFDVDHKSGKAKKNGGFHSINISSALGKVRAPRDLQTNFHKTTTATPVNHDLVAKITNHPHHVAGMSTGQAWHSCMDLNNQKPFTHAALKAAVNHGTHVAYLTHKDDHDIKNPTARIALHPWIGEKGHKVVRPESRVYHNPNGPAPPEEFKHAVHAHAEEHHPMKDRFYVKHHDVYDDDANHDTEKSAKTFVKVNPHLKKDDYHGLLNHEHEKELRTKSTDAGKRAKKIHWEIRRQASAHLARIRKQDEEDTILSKHPAPI